MSIATRLGRPPIRKVAVLRALKVGDLLCAVPALRALRAALPGAEVVLVGLPWAKEFAERFAHLIDGFREFPGFPGLPERAPAIGRIPAFLSAMQAERFDLAVQLHGSGPFVNPVVALFGATHTAGFYLPGDYCPDPDRFLPWPEDGLEVRRLLRLTEFLGAPAQGEHLEFPIRDGDVQALQRLPGPDRPYVCIHPGASVPERRWPADRFARVADALARRGLRVVLTGSDAEAGLTRDVARSMAGAAVDLAGRTNLGVIAALVSRARLLVCNDTGVSHIAAAVGTPSVVISTGDNPARWAPLDTARHHVLCDVNGVPAADATTHALELLNRPAP